MYIVFDIGGTNTRIAASPNGQTLSRDKIVRIPTLKNFQDGISALQEQMQRLLEGRKCIAAAGGFTGFLNPDRYDIVRSVLNPDWEGKNIVRILHDFLDAPVHLENDAVLAALGEAVYGAGKGYEIVAFITISTGMGGARIVDGNIDRVKYSFEPADQIIRAEYAFLSDSEEYEKALPNVAGDKLKKRLGQDARDVPQDHPIWEEYAQNLAIVLFNMTLFWCPDIIVLGGPMIRGTPAIPLDRIRQYTNQLVLRTYPDCPPIEIAELADNAGLYGALAHIKNSAV